MYQARERYEEARFFAATADPARLNNLRANAD